MITLLCQIIDSVLIYTQDSRRLSSWLKGSVCKNNPVYIDMVPDIGKNTNTYEVMPTKEEAGVVMANPLSEADTAAEDKEK